MVKNRGKQENVCSQLSETCNSKRILDPDHKTPGAGTHFLVQIFSSESMVHKVYLKFVLALQRYLLQKAR